MRWKGIITLLVLAGIVIICGLIFTDSWLEKKLETAGSNIIGARVEINKFDISLLGLHVKWDSLQVTDPQDTWKNVLTTGKCEFNMAFLPLLRKKVVIENVMTSNITSGTARTTDGKWEKMKKAKKESKPNVFSKTIARLENEISGAPAWNLEQFGKKVNVDSIIAILNIQSVGKIDSLKNDLEKKYSYWDNTFSEIKLDEYLTRIENQIKSIDPAKIGSIEELQSSLTTVNQVRTDIDSLKKVVLTTKTNVTNDLSFASENIKQVDNWIEDDYKNVLGMAKLPDLSAGNIGKFIFGPSVVNRLNKVLTITGQVRGYASRLKSDKPKKEKPPRLKGQTIHFSSKGIYPDFWIKNILLSGQTLKGVRFSGSVTDLVSDQKVIGHPTRFEVLGSRADDASINLLGEFNYLQDIPNEAIKLTMGGIPMNDVKLAESPLAPYKLKKGTGGLESMLTIKGEEIKGNLTFVADNLSFDMQEPEKDNRVVRAIQSVYAGTNMLNLEAKWASNENKTDLSLNSNLDDLLSARFRSILSTEVADAKTKLQNEVDQRVNKHKAEILQLVNDKNKMLAEKVKEYEDKLNQNIELIENKKKEIENKIEQEKEKQKNKLKDQAKEKLKDVF
ncbi:TIGR03545 family protein [candidate division KSB1 bacterium]|nr:TIGR03545 family protein [candidate division KSB1 bacterium]